MSTYEQIIATAYGHWALQDNAANGGVTESGGASGHFVEGGATTADLSVQDSPAPWVGDRSMLFDGTDDRIRTFTTGPTITEGTIACWAKPAASQADYSGVVSRRDGSGAGFQLLVRSSGRWAYNWADLATHYEFNGPDFVLGAWQHVVLRVTPTKAEFFINGVLTATNTTAHGSRPQAGFMRIGWDSDSASRRYAGGLLDVGQWHTALSDADIATLYAGSQASGRRAQSRPGSHSPFAASPSPFASSPSPIA